MPVPSVPTVRDRVDLRAKLLVVQFWVGIALAPFAALLLSIGASAAAAVLAIVGVVILALSVIARRDNLAEQAGTDLEALRADVRADITTAAQATHRALSDRVAALEYMVAGLQRQVANAAAVLGREPFDEPMPARRPVTADSVRNAAGTYGSVPRAAGSASVASPSSAPPAERGGVYGHRANGVGYASAGNGWAQDESFTEARRPYSAPMASEDRDSPSRGWPEQERTGETRAQRRQREEAEARAPSRIPGPRAASDGPGSSRGWRDVRSGVIEPDHSDDFPAVSPTSSAPGSHDQEAVGIYRRFEGPATTAWQAPEAWDRSGGPPRRPPAQPDGGYSGGSEYGWPRDSGDYRGDANAGPVSGGGYPSGYREGGHGEDRDDDRVRESGRRPDGRRPPVGYEVSDDRWS
jgi:hypothetical protein